jgi:integrase
MAEAKYLAKRGRLVAPNKITVRKYLAEWLDGSAALRKHRALQNAERLQAEEWTDLGMIFPGTGGQLKEGAVIVDALDRTLSRLGLPDVRVHDLRNTAATLWLEENKHPMGVKEFLGHADIGTTLGTYSHVTGRLMQEMADAMDALLFGASYSKVL